LIAAAQHEFETVYGARAANALVRTLGQAPLETGLAQADDDTRAQVRFLARLLYTGEVTRDGQTRALYYPWCLAWRAVSFATAPGLCEGPAFGHWASAPAGATTASGPQPGGTRPRRAGAGGRAAPQPRR